MVVDVAICCTSVRYRALSSRADDQYVLHCGSGAFRWAGSDFLGDMSMPILNVYWSIPSDKCIYKKNWLLKISINVVRAFSLVLRSYRERVKT